MKIFCISVDYLNAGFCIGSRDKALGSLFPAERSASHAVTRRAKRGLLKFAIYLIAIYAGSIRAGAIKDVKL